MRILQIAPIAIPLNPNMGYGGIERVVLALGKSFTRNGHEVFTAAPADSELPLSYGALLPTLARSEWAESGSLVQDPKAYEDHVALTLSYIAQLKPDIVHDHTGNFVFSGAFRGQYDQTEEFRKTPFVATPHDFNQFRKTSIPPEFRNIWFTTLSEYQRGVFSHHVPIRRVINNGVFVEEYPFEEQKDGYLFSLGGIEPAKGQDLAVRVALETELPLRIGGRIFDTGFYEQEIKPHLNGNRIEFIGELDDEQKQEQYRYATASILPIIIGDCFTLTRIESLACGTPVITLDTGSAREAIKNGETGFVVPLRTDKERTVADMIRAVDNIYSISSHRCRQEVKEKFDWSNIANQYLDFYEELLSSR